MILTSKAIQLNMPIREQLNNITLVNSYEHNRLITKHYAKSFYFAAQFLPEIKRRATYALYGFCRYTDNLVDDENSLTLEQKHKQLNDWRYLVEHSLQTGHSDNIVLQSFIEVIKTYNIDPKLPLMLIEGMEMDLKLDRYQTYSDLQRFCYLVASVVGLMMSEVLGYSNRDALHYAVKLGEAMQITNILRDIQEDFERGRIYLPLQDLQAFNYTEENIADKVINKNFKDLIKHYKSRAEILYIEGNNGINLLSKDSRFAIQAASDIYRGILFKIESNKFDVYSKRASLSKANKIFLLSKAIIQNKF